MLVTDLVKHYGTQTAAARAIGVTQSAISNWASRRSGIPAIQQLKIQKKTKGRLKADPSILG